MKRSRRALAVFTLAVICALLAVSTPAAAVTLHVSTSGEGGGDIWRIDGEVGFSATHVISTGLTRLGAIAFGPNGALYEMSGGAVGPAQLWVITGLNGEPSMALVRATRGSSLSIPSLPSSQEEF